MSRQLKKISVKLDKEEVMRIPVGIIIGFDPTTNKVQLHVAGKIHLEQAIDSLATVEYEILNTFMKHLEKDERVDLKTAKKEIYKRAVESFSLMIDQFYPEGKDNKFMGFTNEAVMEAQNALLKKRIEKKK